MKIQPCFLDIPRIGKAQVSPISAVCSSPKINNPKDLMELTVNIKPVKPQ